MSEYIHTIRIIRPNRTPGVWYNAMVGLVFKARIFKGSMRNHEGDFEAWQVDRGEGIDQNCISIRDVEEVLPNTLSKLEELERRIEALERA